MFDYSPSIRHASRLSLAVLLLLFFTCSSTSLSAEQPLLLAKLQPGLVGGWFGNSDYREFKAVELLNTLTFENIPNDRGKQWSAIYQGFLTAPVTGRVTFHVSADYLVALKINGTRLTASTGNERTETVQLEKGRRYPIHIRYAHRTDDTFLRIRWSYNGQDPIDITADHLAHSPAQANYWNRHLENPPQVSDPVTNQNLQQPLTDWSNWPQAYSILMNEKAIFPVDTTFWKMRLDTSRQLFVDNHLLAGTANIKREFHQVEKHKANPVFDDYIHGGYIWPDPEGGYRLYYNQYQLIEGDTIVQAVRLALSDDGIHWRKPKLNLPLNLTDEKQQNGYRIFTKHHVGPQNNVLLPYALLNGLFHEPENPDPAERWKAVVRDYSIGYSRLEQPFLETRDFNFKGGGLEAPVRHDQDQNSVNVFAVNKLYTSLDGIHWNFKEKILPQLTNGRFILDLPTGDKFPLAIGAALRTRWDPVLKKYIAHTKHVIGPDWRFDPVLKGRAQGMMESDDLIHWSSPRIFIYPDSQDAKIPGMYGTYESDAFHYQSMWFGCLSMIAYLPQEEGGQPEKEHWIRLAGSRDGRHFYYLGDRNPLIPPGGAGEWDTHYMRMLNLATTGGPVERDGQLWFYYWGRDQGQSYPKHRLHLGIGRLRLDGFASLNAGEEPGAVATRPLIFDGAGQFYVNVDTSGGGYIQAEVLDQHGDPILGYTVADCRPVQGNHLRAKLSWKDGKTLAQLKDRHIRLVFHLKNAKFYSFWIE